MELVTLTEKEFEKFAKSHPQASFHQTVEWGKLKETNNWKMHLIGLKDGKKVIAATLLLSKMTPIKRQMFYAPRGFLIDYKNYEILKSFTEKIKLFVKENKGIFLKIDPYIIYKERDMDGNIVENGDNNVDAYNNLIKLGYKHFGFNIMQETLQPRWIFTKNTRGKTVDELFQHMDRKTRQQLNKNESNCIKIRELDYSELELFKDIMQKTGDRRDFIDRPLSYYQNLYKYLHDKGIGKFIIAEIHTKEAIEKLQSEIDKYQEEFDDRKYKHDNKIIVMNQKKYEQKQKETKSNIDNLIKRKNEITILNKNKGDIVPLSCVFYLIYGNEVLSLVGGSYQETMEYQSSHTIHWEMIKYAAENDFDRYNFYGITGDFNKSNPLYGLYLFKRGFGGQVVELIGEFDLIINKPMFLLYNVSFKAYKTIKNFVNKIRK